MDISYGRAFITRPLLEQVTVLALLLNIAVPKAGFYVGEIPIPITYGVLVIAGVWSGIKLFASRSSLPKTWRLVLIGVSAFGLANIIVIAIFGAHTSIGTLLGYLIAILPIPLFTLVVTKSVLESFGIEGFLGILRIGVVFIVIFGLISFLSINLTGKNVGIPYITATGPDIDIVLQKHNYRNNADVYKMVSTYNNGNILGVNLLIWLPIAIYSLRGWWLLPRLMLAFGLRILLLLTLSRTVWAGWFVLELLLGWFGAQLKQRLVQPIWRGGITLIACIAVATLLFRNPLAFIFDRSLGGRSEQLQIIRVDGVDTREAPTPDQGGDLIQTSPQALDTAFGAHQGNNWLLPQAFESIREIVYASILRNLGILGLIAFVALWTVPLWGVRTLSIRHDRIALLAKMGVFVYLILMALDGAFFLVPTQFTFWAMVALILHRAEKKPDDAGTACILR